MPIPAFQSLMLQTLSDGEERTMRGLTDLMIEHNLGVSTTRTYVLKEVSNDFFDESGE